MKKSMNSGKKAPVAEKKAAPAPVTEKKGDLTIKKIVQPVSKSAGDIRTPARKMPTHDEIRIRAYEIYVTRGFKHGRDFDDWVEAERQLLRKYS